MGVALLPIFKWNTALNSGPAHPVLPANPSPASSWQLTPTSSPKLMFYPTLTQNISLPFSPLLDDTSDCLISPLELLSQHSLSVYHCIRTPPKQTSHATIYSIKRAILRDRQPGIGVMNTYHPPFVAHISPPIVDLWMVTGAAAIFSN